MDEQRRTNNDTQNDADRWRLFAAAPINDGVRSVMQLAQNRLARHAWPVRWVDPRLGHVTLRFYGDSDTDTLAAIQRDLGDIAARHERMLFQTLGVGAFPSVSRARVLWLGLDGDVARLKSLAIDIDAGDTGGVKRSFKPHVTLARLRGGAPALSDVASAAGALELPSVTLPVDRIQLIRSVLGPKGPTYNVIAEWMLVDHSAAPAVGSAPALHEHT
jgi:RNA 2',3'-cyclic 3'-phosphodiesterase